MTNFPPLVSWETKTFAEDIRYVVRPSPESDGQWEGLYGREFPSTPTYKLPYLSKVVRPK